MVEDMPLDLPEPDTSLFDDGTNRVERCGIIVKNPDGTHWIKELPNRADDPTRDFRIDNADVKAALPPDADIVGVIHTHPYRSSMLPSEADIDSIPRGLVGMVYHPSTTSVAWYDNLGTIDYRQRRKRR